METAKKKIIFHIDVNSAFLSWEAVYRLKELGETLDLRTIPSAVGGDVETRHGVILAKSIPAKDYGIQTGEPVVMALSKCPILKLVKPRHSLYEAYSAAFINVLRDYSPIVEQYSIDEAFMDMTGTEALFGKPEQVAHLIKQRIYEELGFTVNIGISTNKILAKMASDFKKPYLVHTLYPEEIQTKLWPMDVRELFFVGKVAEQKLKRLGIRTIGQLAQADLKLLRQHLNKQGEMIFYYANGRDDAEVASKKESLKSYGNSTTIPHDVSTYEEAEKVLLSLCETIGMRLRGDGVRAYCISVVLTDTFFQDTSHQRTVYEPICSTHDLYKQACKIFKELWNGKIPIRLLGVQASKVVYGQHYQCHLFGEPHHEKYEKLERSIDQIRMKYGKDAVMRSTFVGDAIKHMTDKHF